MKQIPTRTMNKNVLREIKQYFRKNGFAPTIRELSETLGYSKTVIRGILIELESEGYITRRPRCARTISVKGLKILE